MHPEVANLARLNAVREALLVLHKALVDFERVRYESVIGPVGAPNQFLRLLADDPWFAWLHPISQLIVTMDEALQQKREPLTQEAADALVDQSGGLLVASETGQGFSRHYFDSLQEDADVVLAHAAVMKVVRNQR